MAAAVIEDDAKGFDAEEMSEDAFGVTGMRERVALLDGNLTVESRESTGTTIVAGVRVS